MSKLCFECDAPAVHEHHVIPRSLGGKRTIPLCEECHGKAGAVRRALEEALEEWEYAARYKGAFLHQKHGDAEDIARLRKLLEEEVIE